MTAQLNDIRMKLEEIERAQIEQAEQSSNAHRNTDELMMAIQSLENNVQSVQNQLELLKNEKRGMDDDRQELLKARAKLELELADLQRIVSKATSSQSSAQATLATLEKEIGAKQAELATVLVPKFEQAQAREADTTKELQVQERRRAELFSKQSRGKIFKSKAERDTWLTKEVQSLTQAVTAQQKQAKELESSTTRLAQQVDEQSEEIVGRQQHVEERKKAIEDGAREYGELKTKRDELTNVRNQVPAALGNRAVSQCRSSGAAKTR